MNDYFISFEHLYQLGLLTTIVALGMWVHDLQRQITHTRNAVNQLLDQIEQARNDHK